MVEQAEIHRMAQSKYVEERIEALKELRFMVLPDREQSWSDLHSLTHDKDDSVRWRAAESLDLAFSSIPENYREQAWSDLHRLTQDKHNVVRWRAADSLGLAFSSIPENYREQAWSDLHRLTQDKHNVVRGRAAFSLRAAFPHIPENYREQAWSDLHRLTQDKHNVVRWRAAFSLDGAFPHIPEKHREQAWSDLHRLTQDKHNVVRDSAASSLGAAFPHIPENYIEQAWSDLHRLTQDKNDDVRRGAASSLGAAFPHIPEKHREQAWSDMLSLTQDIHYDVREKAAYFLGAEFSHIPEERREQTWSDLHRLTQDKHNGVRRKAADSLSAVFPHIPEKHREQTWSDLISLTWDKNYFVRSGAAESLGAAFPHIPEKHREQTWSDLVSLTQDKNDDVRASANHSLGRASILKATEAENEEDFRKELEKAIGYFESSSKEGTYSNPARFCLPFYRSFYTITFRKQEAEEEVKKYLAEAKRAVRGSESKEKLFEAVENLSNALIETQKAMEMNLEGKKCELSAYRRYCDRAVELLETTEKKAPGATRLIRKGLPIIDERIKGIIGEIQEKSKALCKQTKGTPLEDLGKEINRHGQALLHIRDPIGLEKNTDILIDTLSAICARMPEEDKEETCFLLKKANDEQYIEDKLPLINVILSKIPILIIKARDIKEIHKKLDQIDVKTDKIMEYVQRIEISCNQIISNLEKGGVRLKKEERDELKNLADDLKKANQEQLANFKNELIKRFEDSKCQIEIEKASKKHKPKIKEIFSKIIYELGMALPAAITAEALLPRIEAIMHQITILSEINPALASTFILILITIKKALK